MAPSATTDLPPSSALNETLQSTKQTLTSSPHPAHLHDLATQVAHDLQYQHDWRSISIHTHSPLTNNPLPRPIISGLPPKRAYTHPDEQVEILKAEHKTGERIEQLPEREWVLPTQLQEKMSVGKFAAVFDAVGTVPPGGEEGGDEGGVEGNGREEKTVGWQWQGRNRQKRILLATLHDDSTVVYYIMHDGIVKPRQN
ncbi:Sen15 protein-domain-containing protein [Rhexocercosporidium sp. MPI-PUGE-AT-0058]|nr:Sen15 protein-domain-containing protein [Rhexocercosporidium sp. MPI-PUGE-AT-0058]